MDPPHPVLFALHFPGKKFAELFPRLRPFSAVSKEERGGRAGWRLVGSLDPVGTVLVPEGVSMQGVLLPLSLWIDEQTGLLGEIRIDLTEPYRRDLAAAPQEDAAAAADAANEIKEVKQAIATLRLDDAKLNADIPIEQFRYDAPPEAEEVDQFEARVRPPSPMDLIGKPAPAFSGTAFDGKPLALADLRGRVVLLDFWATWCVPCVAGLPSMQKLAEKFTKEPVTLVGIDQDEDKNEKKARKIIADKKVTFRQLRDADKSIGKAYRIVTIPCAIVIDREGVVQAVHTAASPTLHEELVEEIEKVLKGESLLPPPGRPQPLRTLFQPTPRA